MLTFRADDVPADPLTCGNCGNVFLKIKGKLGRPRYCTAHCRRVAQLRSQRARHAEFRARHPERTKEQRNRSAKKHKLNRSKTRRIERAGPKLLEALSMILPLAERYLINAPGDPDNAKLETARGVIREATEEPKGGVRW